MTTAEKIRAKVKEISPQTEKIALTPEERDAKILSLLESLGSIPRGERANREGRKIRRTLRSLGFFLSRQ